MPSARDVTITAGEVQALAHAVAASPPDGPVMITNADDGTIRAKWACCSGVASLGYDSPQQIP